MKKDTPHQTQIPPFVQQVDDALRRAIATVIAEHQQSGDPLVVAKDGKVVWLKPEEVKPTEISECASDSESTQVV
jgi:hypothetical protein